jgi:carbon-monoxide dehydrogenase large subunit
MTSSLAPETTRFGSGRAVPRVEDAALLAGLGQFADNVAVADDSGAAAHVAFLRSPYAHARILAIDLGAAQALPGVLAVYTGAALAQAGVKPMAPPAAFKRAGGTPSATAARRALAHEVVRFVGEAVVAVWPSLEKPPVTPPRRCRSTTRNCPPSPMP